MWNVDEKRGVKICRRAGNKIDAEGIASSDCEELLARLGEWGGSVINDSRVAAKPNDPMKINSHFEALALNLLRRAMISRTVVLCAFVFATTVGSTLHAVPITINFDNQNESVAAPSNGLITVIITGTISIDPNYHLIGVALDSPTNLGHTNSLSINTSQAFFQFQLQGTGTFSGAILEITVPAGTPADFYGYKLNNNNLAEFGIGVAPNVGGASTGAMQNYSVTVTNGSLPVPENGSTILFLGLCLAALAFAARRAFFLRAWPTTG